MPVLKSLFLDATHVTYKVRPQEFRALLCQVAMENPKLKLCFKAFLNAEFSTYLIKAYQSDMQNKGTIMTMFTFPFVGSH